MAKTTANTISEDNSLQASQPEMELSDTIIENQKEIFNESKAPIKKEVTNKNVYVSPEQTPLKPAERDSRIFMLTNDKRQGNVDIDLEEEVIDPETGKTRAMRLVRRAPSIWLDEQPASSFPASYIMKNILTVMFEQGKVIIPIYEKQKLLAMELSNRNIANKNKMGNKDFYFKEWNPAEENKKAIQEEDAVIKAMQMAISAPYSDMVEHAAYLNIQFLDEHGIKFDEAALRAAYIRYSKNNSNKFLKSIHSPTVKVAYLVRNAFNKGKIDLSLHLGAAYWSDGGFICTLPEGRDGIDYLIEYAQTFGDANTTFKNQLEHNAN